MAVNTDSLPYLQFARHVTRLSRHLQRRLDPPLREELGITALELSALRCVESGFENPMKVAERLALPPSSASRIVDRLAELGLIERGGDPSDRRKAQLRMTPHGEAANESARQLVAEVVKAMFDGLPSADFDASAGLLARLVEHLEAVPQPPESAESSLGDGGEKATTEAGAHA